jgi:hypothetical protein
MALAITLMLPTVAEAQQRTHYDASGKVLGRAVTGSNGSSTFYDAAGRAQKRRDARPTADGTSCCGRGNPTGI